MTPRTQELMMTMLGALGLKVVWTGSYLQYVNEWMKWPILAASLMLIALSVRYLVVPAGTAVGGAVASHGSRIPRVAWLLVLPVLVLFVASPPELGAYTAERRTAANAPRPPINVATDTGPRTVASMRVDEFVSLAQWEPSRNLSYRPVRLTGFASWGPGDTWYVSRLAISCCAADAVSWRVRVAGAPAPARDQWVTVTGRWIDPHAAVPRLDVAIVADEVRLVSKPRNTYE